MVTNEQQWVSPTDNLGTGTVFQFLNPCFCTQDTYRKEIHIKMQQCHEHEDQQHTAPKLHVLFRRAFPHGGDTSEHALPLWTWLSQKQQQASPKGKVPIERQKQIFFLKLSFALNYTLSPTRPFQLSKSLHVSEKWPPLYPALSALEFTAETAALYTTLVYTSLCRHTACRRSLAPAAQTVA